MPARRIINAAMIVCCGNMGAHVGGLHNLWRHIPETARKIIGVAPHRIEMCRLVSSFEVAGFEVAGDGMLFDTGANADMRLISNVENGLRVVLAKFLLDFRHRPAQAGDQLPAVATRCAEPHLLGFEQND